MSDKDLRIGYFSTWRPDNRQEQDQRNIDPDGWKNLPFKRETSPDILFVEGLDKENETRQYQPNKILELFETRWRVLNNCEKQIIIQKLPPKDIKVDVAPVVRTLEINVDKSKGIWLSVCGIHFQAPKCHYDKEQRYYVKDFSYQRESIKSFKDLYMDVKFKDVLFGDFNIDIGNYQKKNKYDIEQDQWMRKYQKEVCKRVLLYDNKQLYTQIKFSEKYKDMHYLDYAYVREEYKDYFSIAYGNFLPNLSDHRYFELIVHTK